MSEPQNLTVEKVFGQREFQSQHGPLIDYQVALSGFTGNHSLVQKPSSPPPKPGDVILGVVEPGKGSFPPKVKKAQQQRAQFSKGGGGKSPEEQRAIAAQHAQKCAVDTLKLAAEHGQYTPPNASDVADHVERIAARLFAQVQSLAKGQG